MPDIKTIQNNIEQLHLDIQKTCDIAGRSSDEIKVVTVTKGHPLDAVINAIEAGVRNIGENFVQEALVKKDQLRKHPYIRWHMIGHIQSRKSRLVVENFDLIHSLDRLKTARRLNRFSSMLNKLLPCFLEINISGEESKYGIPAWNEDEWGKIADHVAEFIELDNLNIAGLMTMAPYNSMEDEVRVYFSRLRRLRDYLSKEIPHSTLNELSMGMSSDFIPAILEGATMIRIGTRIMGPRNARKI